MKGCSVNHYLVKLLHFIHKNIDNKIPHAVILLLCDLSKAYNRGSPSFVLEDLFNMKCPGYLLAIIASYMSERTMKLKFNSAWSEEERMPASFAQGCYLFMILFIVQFNGAALRPAIPRHSLLPSSDRPRLPSNEENKRRLSVKFLDDLSIAGVYNLKEDLGVDNKALPLLLLSARCQATK